MNQENSAGVPGKNGPGPRPSGSRSTFDTFETDFFRKGDETPSTSAEVDCFEDLEEGLARKRFAPSRKLIIGIAIGVACLAVVTGLVSWHAFRRSEPAVSHTPPAIVATPALPVPPTPPSPPSPPAVEPAPAMPSPVAAQAEVVAASSEAGDRCKQAIRDRRNKDILVACTEAYETDPSAAEAAVAVAKIEFDRGRSAQALAWGKKAIAADPNTADAYVFIGSAEQSAGHGKAAKEAYRRYLQLAPGGRYASDLRAIVGSM